MILSHIKKLLLDHNGLTIAQISHKTGYDKPVVEQALSTWERKGMVSTFTQENPCKHCLSACASKNCSDDDTLYIWKNNTVS